MTGKEGGFGVSIGVFLDGLELTPFFRLSHSVPLPFSRAPVPPVLFSHHPSLTPSSFFLRPSLHNPPLPLSLLPFTLSSLTRQEVGRRPFSFSVLTPFSLLSSDPTFLFFHLHSLTSLPSFVLHFALVHGVTTSTAFRVSFHPLRHSHSSASLEVPRPLGGQGPGHQRPRYWVQTVVFPEDFQDWFLGLQNGTATRSRRQRFRSTSKIGSWIFRVRNPNSC